MALFSRIFSPRRKKNVTSTSSLNHSPIKESKSSVTCLEKKDIRVLLFRECDWRGRKLLFDSTAVEKVLLDPNTPISRPRRDSSDMIVEVSAGYGYKYKKPHSDINVLGETIFGSCAMATRGPSIKVHSMKEPARIMFTKVIQAPRAGIRRRQISDERTLDDSQGSSVNSLGETYNSSSFDSKPGSLEVDDSGRGSSGQSCEWLSPHCAPHPSSLDDTDHSSSSLHSGSSLSSLRRRWARSVATTLDFADTNLTATPPGKRTKLGLAVIVPLSSPPHELEQFLLDRLPLVNNILTRLQHSTERAYCRKEVFVQSMFQASIHASQSVCELVGAPRLDTPLWLSLTSERSTAESRAQLAARLVSDLTHLLTTLDTKHTNFFISTLLTAVLTHHLGWVATVFSDLPVQSDSLLTDLLTNHPYNPLWAQLSDLQGALGYPPKIAKTVVVGKSEVLVQKLLSILSYFIRCGQVKASDPERDTPSDEERRLEHLLDNGEAFDKEAIKEFSKAGSAEGSVATSSSTLTKSKTVLSMKTFSVTDCEMDTLNSLESGFESCNESSGKSYEDNTNTKPPQYLTSKLGKSKSCAKLMETSFSENILNDRNVSENCNLPPFKSELSIIKVLENDHKNIIKLESEKQFTSAAKLLDLANRINSESSLSRDKSESNLFIKENVMEPDLFGGVENKVVFVLGENEELVNIKRQDEANVPEIFIDAIEDITNNICNFEAPVILIDNVDESSSHLIGESFETEIKTDFVTGNINNRIVIAHSSPIELEEMENEKTLKTNQFQRCLSVPEEAVAETDWVKKRRCKDVVQLIRRWLSDSAIEQKTNNTLCREKLVNFSRLDQFIPSSVFRTSNSSVTKIERNNSLKHLGEDTCDVPIVGAEDCAPSTSVLADEYTRLPSQSSVGCEGAVRCVEAGVAGSMFGAVSDSYCPELVLQGLVSPPPLQQLQHALLLEAHSSEHCRDLVEAVCVLANTDNWEVTVVSSHVAAVADEGGGVRVGMSHLVASMLETMQHLSSLALPPETCLSHVERRLEELCVRSRALAELLLTCDWLDMAALTVALDLDPSDVPLLLSVAATHSPQVTHKYGLSFQ